MKTMRVIKKYRIFAIFVIWIVIIIVSEKLSLRLIQDFDSYNLPYGLTISHPALFVPFLNFDGRNYLDIIFHGYNQSAHVDLRVFFPVFSILVRALSLNLLINPILVGLGTNLFLAFIDTYLLYKITKESFEEKTAFKTILLLLAFPTSFYLVSFYTESIFLLLTLLVFYFLKKKNLLAASIFTSFATATRITGIALLPVIAWEIYKKYKKTKKIDYKAFIAPLGIIFYSTYNFITVNKPLVFLTSDKQFDKSVSLFAPMIGVTEWIHKVILGPKPGNLNPVEYPIIVLELLAVFFLISFLIVSYKKIDRSYWIYSFFTLILILFSANFSSSQRYLLVVFPIYIFLAKYLPKYIFLGVLIISTSLLVILTALFLRGYWVA